MKYEWYPFYVSDFKADTMHLTAEQDGIYRRLIDHYMETETPLPDNDVALARIAGVSIECFNSSSTTLRLFFKQSNGRLHHKKCDEVLEEMDRRYQKNREKGRKGGKKRAENLQSKQQDVSSTKEQVKPDSSATQAPYLTLPNHTERKKEKINKKKIEFSETFLQFWEIYPRHRRGNKTNAWQAWQKSLAEGRATEDEMLAGAKSYAKSEKGQGEFAKGAAAWINDDRWNWEVPVADVRHQKHEWPEWKHQLAREIGENNVASWFCDAELNGEAIYVPKQFTAENIRTRFLTQIEKAFEKPYQVVVNPITARKARA